MDVSRTILSEITTYMKYAKYDPILNRRENWNEIVDRNKLMHLQKFPNLSEEIESAYKYVYDKKILPSMRSMQFAGKPININNTRLYNCCFLPIDDPVAFAEVMFLLLSGVGVGYSVQNAHIEKLPPIVKPTKTRRYLVGDSIEGWSDAIKVLVKSYFSGKPSPIFDFSDIRQKGANLITAGGKAPGPEPLKDCLHNVQKIFDRKQNGEQLNSIEVHDILCFIADAVLSGGIRRSAMIALFDLDDDNMLTSKFGNWWETNPQRARANNTAVIVRHLISEEVFFDVWKKIEMSGSGEPGIFFTNDPTWGLNPCISGDALITVCDHGINGGLGLPYRIPMKMLVDMCEKNELLPCALSYNETSGQKEWKQITGGMLSKKNAEILEIEYNGKTLKCTPDHKIYTSNRGWVEAQNLQEDDTLINIDEKTISAVNIRQIDKTEDVYDITVEDNHNFFADGILVHNCGEVSLRPFQFCNLCTLNVSDLESQEDYNSRAKAASFIGTLQASYTNFHYLRDIWKKTTEKEALIGISMTGIASGAVLKYDMKEAANVIKAENDRVAKIIGTKSAARTTVVKPEGTASLILGTSSGIHAWHNDHYIRRIRVGKDEAIYSYLSQNHPELVEDEYFKPKQQAVISVPQKAPEGATTRNEKAIDLLHRVEKVYAKWIVPGHRKGVNKNNVSTTVTVKPEEWAEVGDWMWNNREKFTALSVLPYIDHTYIQAPFEDCTKEEYEEKVKLLTNVNLNNVIETTDNTTLADNLACFSGNCEI